MDKFQKYDQCIADCVALLLNMSSKSPTIILDLFDPFDTDDRCMAHMAQIAAEIVEKPFAINCSWIKFQLWKLTDHWARHNVHRTNQPGISSHDVFSQWVSTNITSLNDLQLLELIYNEYYKQLEKRTKKVKKGTEVKS